MRDILLTCPPMILQLARFGDSFDELGWRVHAPEFEQNLSEEKLMELLPSYDGWIIGDDPATQSVVEAGARGRLQAAVKWGVGVDNVDFQAFADCGIPVANTPGMFGQEVADVALGYVIALARRTFQIDRGVRSGGWPKPTGTSLAGKTAAIVGFGDIGRNTARRLAACDMQIIVCDPAILPEAATDLGFEHQPWPQCLAEAHFIVFTCALTTDNYHMMDEQAISLCKPGVRIVNVARGPLIDENALVNALRSGTVAACALDVFEEEPLPVPHPLREFDTNIFGSHNASNTMDAVVRTSLAAIGKLREFLEARDTERQQ